MSTCIYQFWLFIQQSVIIKLIINSFLVKHNLQQFILISLWVIAIIRHVIIAVVFRSFKYQTYLKQFCGIPVCAMGNFFLVPKCFLTAFSDTQSRISVHYLYHSQHFLGGKCFEWNVYFVMDIHFLTWNYTHVLMLSQDLNVFSLISKIFFLR